LEYYGKWLQKTRTEWLFVGNIEQGTSLKIVQAFKESIGSLRKNAAILPKDQISEVRVVNLPPGIHWIAELPLKLETELNSAIVYHFQVGDGRDNRVKVMNMLLDNVLDERSYNQLRTNEQLGYITRSGSMTYRDVLGFYVLVQSNVKDPNYLGTRIEAFLMSMDAELNMMTNEQFEQFKVSVIVNITKKFLSISEEASHYWHEIEVHQYQFDRKRQQLEAINSITKEDFINYCRSVFFYNAKVLEMHAISKTHALENEKIKMERVNVQPNIRFILSPEWFKKRMPLYPDFHALL